MRSWTLFIFINVLLCSHPELISPICSRWPRRPPFALFPVDQRGILRRRPADARACSTPAPATAACSARALSCPAGPGVAAGRAMLLRRHRLGGSPLMAFRPVHHALAVHPRCWLRRRVLLVSAWCPPPLSSWPLRTVRASGSAPPRLCRYVGSHWSSSAGHDRLLTTPGPVSVIGGLSIDRGAVVLWRPGCPSSRFPRRRKRKIASIFPAGSGNPFGDQHRDNRA